MKSVGRILLALGAALVLTPRLQHARQVYGKEVASGSKPIEAVGTAVAAFVGFDVR
jgi:hypothetical protein